MRYLVLIGLVSMIAVSSVAMSSVAQAQTSSPAPVVSPTVTSETSRGNNEGLSSSVNKPLAKDGTVAKPKSDDKPAKTEEPPKGK